MISSKFMAMCLCFGIGISATCAAEQTSTLEKVKEKQKITLGVRDFSIPFSYLDDKQSYRGYSVDLCLKIVDAVKRQLKLKSLEVKYAPVTSANRIEAMQDGTIDLECGSTTNNMEREKQVAFAPTTFVSATRLLSKKSSQIHSLGDLIGKTVVTTAGTTAFNQITILNNDRNFGMKIIPAKDHMEAFQIVQNDKATSFFMDDILLASFVATVKNPDDYELTQKDFSVEPEFAKLVNTTISGLMISGEIRSIYTKWFQSPLPGNGINLNLPMSRSLAAAFFNPTNSGNPEAYDVVPAAQKAIARK